MPISETPAAGQNQIHSEQGKHDPPPWMHHNAHQHGIGHHCDRSEAHHGGRGVCAQPVPHPWLHHRSDSVGSYYAQHSFAAPPSWHAHTHHRHSHHAPSHGLSPDNAEEEERERAAAAALERKLAQWHAWQRCSGGGDDSAQMGAAGAAAATRQQQLQQQSVVSGQPAATTGIKRPASQSPERAPSAPPAATTATAAAAATTTTAAAAATTTTAAAAAAACAAEAGGAAATAAEECPPEGPPRPPRCVLVFDLDETLLIFNSLISGQYARDVAGPGRAAEASALGERWQDAILSLSDDHLLFSQVEEHDYVSLSDLQATAAAHERRMQREAAAAAAAAVAAAAASAPDPGLISGAGVAGSPGRRAAAVREALAHELLAKLRAVYRRRPHEFAPRAVADRWAALLRETDAFVGGWISAAAALLRDCERLGRDGAGGGSSSSGGQSGGQGAVAGNGRAEGAAAANGATATTTATPAAAAAAASAAEEQQAAGAPQDNGGNSGGSGSSGGACGDVRLVLVTNTQLVPAYSKLMLYDLAPFFSLEDVYCSRTPGKLRCFQMLQERFGDAPVYHAIGDGAEEAVAARALGWRFTRVDMAAGAADAGSTVHGAGVGRGVTIMQLRAQDLIN